MPTLKPVNFNPFEQKPKTSVPASIIEGVTDTASFGLKDEMAAALGSVPGYLMSKAAGGDKSLGETYDTLLENRRAQDKQAFEDNPGAYIAGGITGAIGTGGAAAGTKAGAKLATSLSTGGRAARVAKGAAVGATSGAAYGAGSAEEGQRLEGAGQGALYGGLGGGAAPIISSAVGKGLKRLSTKKLPQLNSDDLKALSSQAYEAADKSGAVLKPQVTNKFLNALRSIDDVSPEARAFRTDDSISKMLSQADETLRGKPLTLKAAQDIDEALGELITKQFKDGLNKQGSNLMKIQDALRDTIEKATDTQIIGGKAGFESLKEARRLWSRSRSMRDIERILERAEMMQVPANGVKSGFRTLANNPKRMRGFTPEERALIKKAAKTGVVTDALNILGSRLNPIIALGSGGNPAAAAATHAGGTLSRKGAEGLQMRRAGKVLQSISDDVQRGANGVTTTSGSAAPIGAGTGAAALPEGMPQPKIMQPKLKPVDFNPFEGSQLEGNAGNDTLETSFYDRLAQAESGGNPNAKAKTSSASGLFQFTDGTWNAMVKKYGKQTGITGKMKNDPEAQRVMVELLTKENAQALSKALGREPNDGELYLAHFAGAGGAKKLLTAPQNAPAARVLPSAARANKTIFFDGKKPRTVAEVRQVLAAKI